MIPLTMPNLTGNEKKYLDNCIDTTYVSSVGEYVTRLEEMVCFATGSRYAVATSAGTTGLHAALSAAGVKHGDLVVVPTFTFIATANAVRHCGADTWLMDITDSDWTMDAGLVKEELEKNTKLENQDVIHIQSGKRVGAIMPVYTLGNIPDMKMFRAIADHYHLPLIADAACAIGAAYDSQQMGGLADLSVISFNGNKTITCGGGGMVIGNDEEQMKLVRHLTTTARVSPEYDFDMVGFNYRMTNIQAAVGCAQMERLDEFLSVKSKVRKWYSTVLEDLDGIRFFPRTKGSSCWMSGIVLENGGLEKIRRMCNKLKNKGIEARSFWKPVHLQAPYVSSPKGTLDVSDSLWDRIITLPCSTGITDDELSYVAEMIREILETEGIDDGI